MSDLYKGYGQFYFLRRKRNTYRYHNLILPAFATRLFTKTRQAGGYGGLLTRPMIFPLEKSCRCQKRPRFNHVAAASAIINKTALISHYAVDLTALQIDHDDAIGPIGPPARLYVVALREEENQGREQYNDK